MAISSLFLGCCASSRSFAESRCVRASSTGPKTLLFKAALLAFLVLARAPFAMVVVRKVEQRKEIYAEIFNLILSAPTAHSADIFEIFLISEGPSFFSAEGGGLFSAIYW